MDDFFKICEKDIREMYNIINPYLPDFKIDNLNQSVIYEENRKILCRSIKNDKKEIIGHEIAIYTYDNHETIKLIKRINSTKLEKRYYKDNKSIKEKVRISLTNNTVKRYFLYSENDYQTHNKETYDLNIKEEYYNYLSSDSIENILNSLKPKNKTRKID